MMSAGAEERRGRIDQVWRKPDARVARKPPREDAGRRRVRRARRWARAARLDAVGYDGHERHRADSPSRLKRRARGRGGRKPPPTARCDRAGNPNREDESTAHVARARTDDDRFVGDADGIDTSTSTR